MPNWNWHVALARDISKIIEIKDFNDFVYGSLLPDTPWETLEESLSSGDRYALHVARMMDYSSSTVPDVSRFLDKAFTMMVDTDLACGWYTHLVLDEAVNDHWNLRTYAVGLNRYAYVNSFTEDYMSSSEIAEMKWKDVASYAAQAFGDVSDVVPTSISDLSQDGILLMTETLNISEKCIDSSFRIIRNKIRELSMCRVDKYKVSKDYYDAIHSECVAKCCRVLSEIQSMRH